MKKRIISCLLVLVLCVSTATIAAANDISLRWAYLSSVSRTLKIDGDGLMWGADARAYAGSGVTSSKISVKLQREMAGGIWTTVESASETAESFYVGAGDTYYDWDSGESYRLTTDVYLYNDTELIEHVGTYYDYLDT